MPADRAASVQRHHHRHERQRLAAPRAKPALPRASDNRRRAPAPSARSAVSAAADPSSSIVASRRCNGVSAARTSMATIPCPGAGTQTSTGSANEMRAANPSRRRPAAASTRASMRAFIELAQPRVQIAANRLERGAGKQSRQLGNPPHAAGADRRRPPEPRHQILDRRRGPPARIGHARAVRPRRADLLAAGPRRSPGRPAAPPACPCCCAPRDRSRREAGRPRFP